MGTLACNCAIFIFIVPIYICNTLCIAKLISSCFLCRQVIEVQHIVNVLAGWLALRMQKTEKSFTVQWTTEIPIGVSEHSDTACSAPPASVSLQHHSVMYDSVTIVILISGCQYVTVYSVFLHNAFLTGPTCWCLL